MSASLPSRYAPYSAGHENWSVVIIVAPRWRDHSFDATQIEGTIDGNALRVTLFIAKKIPTTQCQAPVLGSAREIERERKSNKYWSKSTERKLLFVALDFGIVIYLCSILSLSFSLSLYVCL